MDNLSYDILNNTHPPSRDVLIFATTLGIVSTITSVVYKKPYKKYLDKEIKLFEELNNLRLAKLEIEKEMQANNMKLVRLRKEI